MEKFIKKSRNLQKARLTYDTFFHVERLGDFITFVEDKLLSIISEQLIQVLIDCRRIHTDNEHAEEAVA